jgi:hypothetical protein
MAEIEIMTERSRTQSLTTWGANAMGLESVSSPLPRAMSTNLLAYQYHSYPFGNAGLEPKDLGAV